MQVEVFIDVDRIPGIIMTTSSLASNFTFIIYNNLNNKNNVIQVQSVI